MIDGLEFYAEGIEVEFQYPKNPTEIKLKPLIQFSDKLTFTHFISNVSGEELENEPVLDPPDIPPDLQEGIEFRDELSFVLEKWNPNE